MGKWQKNATWISFGQIGVSNSNSDKYGSVPYLSKWNVSEMSFLPFSHLENKSWHTLPPQCWSPTPSSWKQTCSSPSSSTSSPSFSLPRLLQLESLLAYPDCCNLKSNKRSPSFFDELEGTLHQPNLRLSSWIFFVGLCYLKAVTRRRFEDEVSLQLGIVNIFSPNVKFIVFPSLILWSFLWKSLYACGLD